MIGVSSGEAVVVVQGEGYRRGFRQPGGAGGPGPVDVGDAAAFDDGCSRGDGGCVSFLALDVDQEVNGVVLPAGLSTTPVRPVSGLKDIGECGGRAGPANCSEGPARSSVKTCSRSNTAWVELFAQRTTSALGLERRCCARRKCRTFGVLSARAGLGRPTTNRPPEGATWKRPLRFPARETP